MDPGARHLVWEVLRPEGVHDEYDLPATLFSTHYMDEASKLGTRIGIMIDGELITTGTLDRLQERYCNSYFVEIALEQGAPPDLEDDVVNCFVKDGGMEDTTVYESLSYHIKLQVPFSSHTGHGDTTQLAKIFELLESHKTKLHIKFYSVAQMSLEQIFIDLSRKQFDAEESYRVAQEESNSRRRLSSRMSSRRI